MRHRGPIAVAVICVLAFGSSDTVHCVVAQDESFRNEIAEIRGIVADLSRRLESLEKRLSQRPSGFSDGIHIHDILTIVFDGRTPGFAFFESLSETGQKHAVRVKVTVVDVRPNGTILLKGLQTQENEDRQIRQEISGTASIRDLQSDNSIRSDDIANLTIVIAEQNRPE